MRDWTFQKTFSRLFVYNILFEDAEVDGRFLELDEDSTVLSISAAGCGVASMLRFQPRSIDAVDINKHHLALAALRMNGAQRLDNYAEFYDLFGRGWHPSPQRRIKALSAGLPDWMQRYWKLHYPRFRRSLYNQGLTAQMLRTLRRLSGVDAAWLRSTFHMDPDDRAALVKETFTPIIKGPVLKRVTESPLQLLALGINFEQRNKLVADTGGDVGDFILEHLQNLARTDVETNWFAWYGVAGHYNHENDKAVPPYLRRASHERSLDAPTDKRFHHANLFDVMGKAEANTWSHYTFCDAIDWMPGPVQKRLMDEVVRTARPGAIVLWRSVEEDDVVARHRYGDRLQRMEQASAVATRQERSRQYKRVDFYRVQA